MWAKVDDQWWMHPKVMPLGMAARGLWVTALSYSGARRCDHVTVDYVRMVAGPEADDLAAELVDAGLWHTDGDGWTIHDWDDYQVSAESEQKAAAGRVGGLTRALKQAEARAEAAERALSEQNPSTGQAESKHPASTPQADGQAEPGSLAKHGPEPEPDPTPVRTDPVEQAPRCVHRLDRQGRHRSDNPCDACTAFLEHFWPAYPERKGRKLGKGEALVAWMRLSDDERRRAFVGARNNAADPDAPTWDAKRFLTRTSAGTFRFDDFQDPPVQVSGRGGVPHKRAGPLVPVCPDCDAPMDDRHDRIHAMMTGQTA